MTKGKDLERLSAFSDAIVAVAITLLVLPLTDLFKGDGNLAVIDILKSYEFISTFSSLIISCFVIYGFWAKHRRVFENITEIKKSVERINKLWLFSIILIPAATNINFSTNSVVGIWIYGGVLLVSSVTLQAMNAIVHPDVKFYQSSTIVILTISLILVTLVPTLGHTVFYLLFLGRPIRKYVLHWSVSE